MSRKFMCTKELRRLSEPDIVLYIEDKVYVGIVSPFDNHVVVRTEQGSTFRINNLTFLDHMTEVE